LIISKVVLMLENIRTQYSTCMQFRVS
jgi:hypothetical protein